MLSLLLHVVLYGLVFLICAFFATRQFRRMRNPVFADRTGYFGSVSDVDVVVSLLVSLANFFGIFLAALSMSLPIPLTVAGCSSFDLNHARLPAGASLILGVNGFVLLSGAQVAEKVARQECGGRRGGE